MKKLVVLAVVVILIFSCAKKTETSKESEIKEEVGAPIVGGDSDEHGCITSAGYSWSIIKNECVRVFEIGTRLNPENKQNTSSAFVIFEENGNKAELFVAAEKSSLILERKVEGQPWINGDWQLISEKGYVLKKASEIQYKSE
jgi:hypothetical protein